MKKETAELPTNMGGLAAPNLKNFWDSLKLAWLSRLFQTNDAATWKRLAMSRLSFALRLPKLTLTRLLAEGPTSIAKASAAISNPFWQSLWKLLPKLEKTFYNKYPKATGERIVWDNDDFLCEGQPFSRRSNSRILTLNFNFIHEFVSPKTKVLMSEEEATALLGVRLIPTWNKLVESITAHLTSKNLTWYSIDKPATGPIHWGWSRLVTECHKARKFYPLLMTRPGDPIRNSNERAWTFSGLTHYNATRWDQLYQNQSNLRCSLRVKWEEYRVLWGRQELNRYRSRYANQGGDMSTACSYCREEIETEIHLYVECDISREFWQAARSWYTRNIGVSPPIVLTGPLLFGLEKEQPQDLCNIFYRSARYCIFKNRKKTFTPSLKYFIALVKDELRLKYRANRIVKFANKPEEAKAVAWLRAQMGWLATDLNWPKKS